MSQGRKAFGHSKKQARDLHHLKKKKKTAGSQSTVPAAEHTRIRVLKEE
jgi:hypothetical protein